MKLKDEIRKFILQNFILDESEALEDGDSLLENGIIDSTGVLELVAFLEENYGIAVEDEELIPENLDSIQNIVEFINRKVKGLTEPKARESQTLSPG